VSLFYACAFHVIIAWRRHSQKFEVCLCVIPGFRRGRIFVLVLQGVYAAYYKNLSRHTSVLLFDWSISGPSKNNLAGYRPLFKQIHACTCHSLLGIIYTLMIGPTVRHETLVNNQDMEPHSHPEKPTQKEFEARTSPVHSVTRTHPTVTYSGI
jgi:hypothetical protein